MQSTQQWQHLCVVESVKLQNEFADFNHFYQYASRYSVFDKDDLYYWYCNGGCKVVKMTYNAALKKRIVRHSLIEEIGLDRSQYWGFFQLNDKQFMDICKKGEIINLLK